MKEEEKEEECLTWSDHDLVLFRSDSEKSEVVLWIDVAHDASRLGGELMEQAGILHGCRVVQRGLDRYSFGIDDDETKDALVRRDSLYCLLNLALLNVAVEID